jgi:hypothetical protein
MTCKRWWTFERIHIAWACVIRVDCLHAADTKASSTKSDRFNVTEPISVRESFPCVLQGYLLEYGYWFFTFLQSGPAPGLHDMVSITDLHVSLVRAKWRFGHRHIAFLGIYMCMCQPRPVNNSGALVIRSDNWDTILNARDTYWCYSDSMSLAGFGWNQIRVLEAY